MATLQNALFAAGCFWSTEYFMQQAPGVVSTRHGYCGGTVAHPNHAQLLTGATGHAETVEVTFDAEKTCYEALVLHFFNSHNPFRNVGRRGGLYDSVIFYTDTGQYLTALQIWESIRRKYSRPVTVLKPAGAFYPAPGFASYYRQRGKAPVERAACPLIL